jgi:hypothetical protein
MGNQALVALACDSDKCLSECVWIVRNRKTQIIHIHPPSRA